MYVCLLQPISREERETIARLRNCIQALVQKKLMLFDTSIQYTFEASRTYEVCNSLCPLSIPGSIYTPCIVFSCPGEGATERRSG